MINLWSSPQSLSFSVDGFGILPFDDKFLEVFRPMSDYSVTPDYMKHSVTMNIS